MSAFDEDVFWAEALEEGGHMNDFGYGVDGGERDSGVCEEEFCFGDVGGEDCGQGEEVLAEVCDGGVGEELGSACCDHDLGVCC